MFVTFGAETSIATKKVVTVAFTLLSVSFAMNVMLYCPVTCGTAKDALYLFPTASDKLTIMLVPFGNVMFARTEFTPMLSVTFAAISIVWLVLNVEFAEGRTSKTSGALMSVTSKKPVSVLFELPVVSFAKILNVY